MVQSYKMYNIYISLCQKKGEAYFAAGVLEAALETPFSGT